MKSKFWKVLLSPLGFSSTLKYFLGRGFNYPQDVSTSDGQVKLAELANSNFKNKEGPIVIFFEVTDYERIFIEIKKGATTNGKGVLEMPEGLAYDLYEYQKQENRETVVATVIFNENEEASVSHPIIASLSFLMNWSNPATVRLCPIASKNWFFSEILIPWRNANSKKRYAKDYLWHVWKYFANSQGIDCESEVFLIMVD